MCIFGYSAILLRKSLWSCVVRGKKLWKMECVDFNLFMDSNVVSVEVLGIGDMVMLRVWVVRTRVVFGLDMFGGPVS